MCNILYLLFTLTTVTVTVTGGSWESTSHVWSSWTAGWKRSKDIRSRCQNLPHRHQNPPSEAQYKSLLFIKKSLITFKQTFTSSSKSSSMSTLRCVIWVLPSSRRTCWTWPANVPLAMIWETGLMAAASAVVTHLTNQRKESSHSWLAQFRLHGALAPWSLHPLHPLNPPSLQERPLLSSCLLFRAHQGHHRNTFPRNAWSQRSPASAETNQQPKVNSME